VKLVSAMCATPSSLAQRPCRTRQGLAELAARAAASRLKSAQKVEKKKQSSVVVLPGKLSDASGSDPESNELFWSRVTPPAAPPNRRATARLRHPAAARQGAEHLEVEPERLYANNEVHDMPWRWG